VDKQGYKAYLQSLGNRNDDSIKRDIKRLDDFEREFNIILDDYIPYNNDYSKVDKLNAIQPIHKQGEALAFVINDYMKFRLSGFIFDESIEYEPFLEDFFRLCGPRILFEVSLSSFMSEDEIKRFIDNIGYFHQFLGDEEFIKEGGGYNYPSGTLYCTEDRTR
jgi:hypothetical protein